MFINWPRCLRSFFLPLLEKQLGTLDFISVLITQVREDVKTRENVKMKVLKQEGQESEITKFYIAECVYKMIH